MRFKSFTLALLTLVFLFPAASFGQAPKIKESDLESTSITAGPLKLTLIEYRGSYLKVGNGSTYVEVENVSDEFAAFSPLLLSFVGNDNRQADVLAIVAGNFSWTASTRNIAPGARIKEYYALTGKVKLPARLYYDKKLIAEIN